MLDCTLWKLNYGEPLSNFAFSLNLRRYKQGAGLVAMPDVSAPVEVQGGRWVAVLASDGLWDVASAQQVVGAAAAAGGGGGARVTIGSVGVGGGGDDRVSGEGGVEGSSESGSGGRGGGGGGGAGNGSFVPSAAAEALVRYARQKRSRDDTCVVAICLDPIVT